MEESKFIKYGIAAIQKGGGYYLEYLVGKLNRVKKIKITKQEYDKIINNKECVDQIIKQLEDKCLEKTIFDDCGIEILEYKNNYNIMYSTGEIILRLKKEKISKEEACHAKQSQEKAQEIINICKERSPEKILCYIPGEMEVIKDSDRYYMLYILDGIGPKVFSQEISKEIAYKAKDNMIFAKNLLEEAALKHKK